jgi:hypothetical protein
MSKINKIFETENGEQWEIIEITDQDADFGIIYRIRRVYDAKESYVTDQALETWEHRGRITWV